MLDTTAANPSVHPVARLLPPEEWGSIPGFQHLSPAHAIVVVVEDGGPGGPRLAQWAAMNVPHVEGLEIAEPYRGHAGVARALLTFMVEVLTSHGVREVLTQAFTPELARLIAEAGGRRVPGDTWVIPLGGGS